MSDVGGHLMGVSAESMYHRRGPGRCLAKLVDVVSMMVKEEVYAEVWRPVFREERRLVGMLARACKNSDRPWWS